MPRRLIIIGASARAAAFSAARAGFEPYAIDLFADLDLAAHCPAARIEDYPHGFLRALSLAPDAPWLYTGGLENHPRLIERMAAVRPLWGSDAAAVRAIRDPRRLAQVLAEEGFAYPPLGPPFASSGQGGRRLLVKPFRSSAGLGIRFASESDFANPPRRTVLQEYVEGENCSAVYVAAKDRAVLLGASRQLLGRDLGVSPDFLYAGSLAPLELSKDQRTKLKGLGNSLARRFGLVGLFGVDFVRTADELWTIEVNPRYSASVEVLERVTGQHFIALHADACVRGELPPVPRESNSYAGKAVVYARRECQWIGDPADLGQSAWPDLADIPQPQAQFVPDQPIATVFATGESLGDVERELRIRERNLLARLASPLNI